MDITIRQYEDRDYDALIKCMEDLHDYEVEIDPIHRLIRKDGFGKSYTDCLLDDVREKQGVICFAEKDGKIVGCVAGCIEAIEKKYKLGMDSDKPYGYVMELFVDKEFRNQGIGANLVGKMEEYFRAKGCDMSSMDVFATNTAGHEFYKKIGYMDRNVNLVKKL